MRKNSKDQRWTKFILSSGYDFDNIRPGQPTQLMRIRTKPESPDPCPGILLWLEIPPEDAVLDGIEHFDSDKKQPVK